MWDEITYPFLNFNGATVEVYEWISNFIPQFKYVYNYLSMLGLNLKNVSKRGPRCRYAVLLWIVVVILSFFVTACDLFTFNFHHCSGGIGTSATVKYRWQILYRQHRSVPTTAKNNKTRIESCVSFGDSLYMVPEEMHTICISLYCCGWVLVALNHILLIFIFTSMLLKQIYPG